MKFINKFVAFPLFLLMAVSILPVNADTETEIKGLQATLRKDVIPQNTEIIIDVKYEESNGYFLEGWLFAGYEPFLPEGLRNVENIVFRPERIKRWNCYIFGNNGKTRWLPSQARNKYEHTLTLPTPNWVYGDYQTELSLIFKNADNKQITIKNKMLFTIVEADKGK